MLRNAMLALCVVGGLAPLQARASSNAIAADHNPIMRGEAVTLRWYFTGTRVVVSGGRFHKGVVVTGRTALSDRPNTTTRYTFDVWYRAPYKREGSSNARSTSLHSRYSIVVTVVPGLSAYEDPHGWRIAYLLGWKRDNVPTPDEGSDGIVFFQRSDDSVERLAVAVIPVKNTTCAGLMDRVRADMPAHYDAVQIVSQETVSHQGVPAVFTTFTGNDQTHPGTRTESVILALVRGGRAYVISARTSASEFAARRALLEAMVNSFRFTHAAPPTINTANATG